MRKGLTALAILFVAAHLPSLPPSLEDLDSVNFALGVRDFEVAEHQPHPPGYPVYVALSKVSTAALGATGIPSAESRGLAVWSALGGALVIILAASFFRALGDNSIRPALAAALLGSAPLFWFTALRPLSDMAGLAAAFAALVPLAAAIGSGTGVAAHQGQTGVRRRSDPTPTNSAPGADGRSGWLAFRDAPAGRLLTIGAFLAGVAIGVRSQTFLLTLPLLAFALLRPRGGMPVALRLQSVAACVAGILLWAIPLAIASGGPGAYLIALRSQGAEDFSGVVMLWTHRTVRVAAYAFLHTFVVPWRSPLLAATLLVLATLGLALLVRRSPRMLGILAIVFGPYAVFHLLFQETVTVRYALPLLPPVAYAAVAGLAGIHRTVAVLGVAILAVAGLALSVPAGVAYGRAAAPVFRMLADMREAQRAPVAIGMHRRVFTETRRPRLWSGGMPADLLPAPRDYEWLELTQTLREHPDQPAWFIADPRRTDLALIDPHSPARPYRWPFDSAAFAGGARPGEMSWRIYSQPGWFLEQGWALTPEVAGITHRDGWGPHKRPSVGWIRRREEEALLMFGGRHLGPATDSPAVVIARIDGRELLRLRVTPGFFFHTARIPGGTLEGDGAYARLTVTVESATGGAAAPPVAIEQFDLQPPATAMVGFAGGWHEPEYNPNTGRSWRWLSDRAVLWIHTGGRRTNVCLEGESPRKYYDDAPAIRVSAGSQELGTFNPDDDFFECIPIPPAALDASEGRVTIESDRTHVPAEREGVADRRRLGLRIYSVALAPGGRG